VTQEAVSQSHFIREWRTFRGITQAELAQAIRVDRTYLNKIERGKRRYVPEVLEAVASKLDCAPGDLLSRRPGHASEIEIFCESLNEADRARAVAVLKALFGR